MTAVLRSQGSSIALAERLTAGAGEFPGAERCGALAAAGAHAVALESEGPARDRVLR